MGAGGARSACLPASDALARPLTSADEVRVADSGPWTPGRRRLRQTILACAVPGAKGVEQGVEQDSCPDACHS